MALIIETTRPQALLNSFKKAIDDKKVETWSYDADGDFTHSPEQLKSKAWLRPIFVEGKLKFGIIKLANTNVSKLIYGIYHGRFIEMLLAHFDSEFSLATATAQITKDDSF
jgi:hypothetical protein